eukprot:scaffold130053_cov54-Phaeocystis_antarctica.AAC.7
MRVRVRARVMVRAGVTRVLGHRRAHATQQAALCGGGARHPDEAGGPHAFRRGLRLHGHLLRFAARLRLGLGLGLGLGLRLRLRLEV